MEEKPKMRSSKRKEEATSFTSGVFALLDVYLTKMLVSHLLNLCNMFDTELHKLAQASVLFCINT